MESDIAALLESLYKLHAFIREQVVRACETVSIEQLSGVERETAEDTIYAIDQISEEALIHFFEQEVAVRAPVVLIAEGLPEGKIVLPRSASESAAVWRIIVDPIDGTRGLMYQKRSAWILTGAAPNRGEETSLQDIELAIQTEIPLLKQYLSDTVWAIKGQGWSGERFNRINGEKQPLYLQPSGARSIAHGFATVARFFPGAREVLAAIDEAIVHGALGPVLPGKAHCFEDQYISTAGQLYELMNGHDRFVADLRPLVERELAKQDLALGICCHPYDLCTELIAREVGVIVREPQGDLLNAPLNLEHNIAWAGYANPDICAEIEPLLQDVLRKKALL